jgi:hypothetical protein
VNLAFKIVLVVCLFGMVSCALSPEEQEKLDAEISACETEGGKAYVGMSTVVKCASSSEQVRLETLELECVKSGGTVSYAYGGFYENCQRQPSSVINNSVSVSNSTKTSLGKPCANGWIKNSQQDANGVTTCFWQCDVSASVKNYEQTSGRGACPLP